MSTQTMIPIVSGFTYTGTGDSLAVNNISTKEGVYTSIIDSASVSAYSSLMTVLQTYINNPTGTNPNTADAMHALQCLNAWANMTYVDSAGVQHPTDAEVSAAGSPYTTLYDENYNVTGYRFTFPVSNSTSYSSVVSTMSKDMAQQFQSVVRLLGSFGFNVPGIGTDATYGTAAALSSTITKMTTNGVLDTLKTSITSAISAAHAAKTQYTQSGVQEMLMTDYVTHGNELIYNEMTGLQEAIDTNQTVLAYCNGLQALMNQKDASTFTLALGPLSSYGTTITADQYQQYEQQSFNQNIGTTASFSYAGLQTYVSENGGLLQNAFKVLDPSSPYSTANGGPGVSYTTDNVVNNLVYIYKELSKMNGSETGALQNLRSAIGSVYNNLTGGTISYKSSDTPPCTTGNFNQTTHTIDAGRGIDLATWVTNYNASTGAQNDFQTNLTNATTASQSFNDAQRERLNEVMFVFQEFYQSASTLLSNINDVISRMAQMITK